MKISLRRLFGKIKESIIKKKQTKSTASTISDEEKIVPIGNITPSKSTASDNETFIPFTRPIIVRRSISNTTDKIRGLKPRTHYQKNCGLTTVQ